MSTTTSFPTPIPASSTVAATDTNLFPTTTASSATSSSSNGSSPSVYYLVFLGVLVVLALLAAVLTLRAIRLRRRYYLARQQARLRGEPPLVAAGWWTSEGRDEFWGFGGFAADGARGHRNGRTGREKKARKLGKRPELYEAEALDEGESLLGEDDDSREEEGMEKLATWSGMQPVTVHSLAPLPEPVIMPEEPPIIDIPNSRSFNGSNWRHVITGSTPPRPPISFSPPSQSQVNPPIPSDKGRVPSNGESVSVAVVIQMPVPSEMKDRRGPGGGLEAAGSEMDEEEQVGWVPGMELGVWKGVVVDLDATSSHTETAE